MNGIAGYTANVVEEDRHTQAAAFIRRPEWPRNNPLQDAAMPPVETSPVAANLNILEKRLNELHGAIETHEARLQDILGPLAAEQGINAKQPAHPVPLVANLEMIVCVVNGAISRIRSITDRLAL